MSDAPTQAGLAELTAEIVSAFVSNHQVPASSLGEIIETVGKRLATLSTEEADATPAKPEPVVPVRRSVSRDSITCLMCGKQQKLLKRHLSVAHDLTPAEYRSLFELKADYPMVAPSYAEARSELALKTGLGRAARPDRKPKTTRAPRKAAAKS
jgi:predicted transcriptional regulator